MPKESSPLLSDHFHILLCSLCNTKCNRADGLGRCKWPAEVTLSLKPLKVRIFVLKLLVRKTKQKKTPPHPPSKVNHLLRASSGAIDNCYPFCLQSSSNQPGDICHKRRQLLIGCILIRLLYNANCFLLSCLYPSFWAMLSIYF